MTIIKYKTYTFEGTGESPLLLSPTSPPNIYEVWNPISEALAWDVLSFGVRSDATGAKFIWTSLGEIYATNSGQDYVIDDGDLMQYTRGEPVDVYQDGAFYRRFYLDSITARQGGYFEFSAVSAVGLLAERYHRGGVFFGATAGDVIAEIMGLMDYDLAGDVADVTLYGWLPYDTARNNLARVLFATGASFMTSADGSPNIRFNQPQGSTDVSAATYYDRTREPVATYGAVRITEHTFFDSAAQTEKVLFDNRNGVAAASALIVFDEPMAATRADGLTRESWGANWAVVTGTGVLYGTPYVHIQRLLERPTGINSAEVYEAPDDALISRLNSSTVLDRLTNYYANAVQYQIATVHSTERPGQIIDFPGLDGGTVSGYITQMDSEQSSFVYSTIDAITNWIPTGLGNQYNTYFIITSAPGGVITIPAAHRGKKALAVLFSGAQGGSGGYDGERGGNGRSVSETTRSRGYGGAGGEGGAPGEGGGPGRYLIVDIDSLAASYPGTIGTGGAGGAHNGEPGTIGGNTTLDEYTTADGVVPEGPYINMIDGTRYGERGGPGTYGKAGGAGGNLPVTGRKGEDGLKGQDYNTIWRGGAGGLGVRRGTLTASGGGGGGAAYGTSGPNGGTSTENPNYGAPGANATPPAQAPFYTGGRGGNGGGGGGGSSYSWNELQAIYNHPGDGGLGSIGGQGADGFILIYV